MSLEPITTPETTPESAPGAPAWARWVRLAARVRVQEVRAGWRDREADRAGAVHAEIDAILRDTAFTVRRGADAEAIERAGAEALAEPRLATLVSEFDLTLHDAQWLALLAMCQADPRWSRVLGYLEDDLRPLACTPSAAALLWGWAPGEASLLGPDCALATWDLAGPTVAQSAPGTSAASTWTPDTPWAAAPRIVAYLCGLGQEDALRRGIGAAASTLLSPLPCPYDWTDLILNAAVDTRLRDLEARVRLRSEVLDGWDFGRLNPGSRGVTALFAGPSGTGKTMAAQVLARSLGLELYRADLAEVVDKYIGETEKRLAKIFEECEKHRVLLLFDEADALFGQRTRVRDAHDRFANIEIDYLLQRLETFAGTAILATNRKSDLDQAFLRRLAVVIDFLSPAPAERLRLWRLALPERTTAGEPLSDGIDALRLADELELTGAEIKAVALTAAYFARSRNELIGMAHVMEAARIEFAKRGEMLRTNGVRHLTANGSGVH